MDLPLVSLHRKILLLTTFTLIFLLYFSEARHKSGRKHSRHSGYFEVDDEGFSDVGKNFKSFNKKWDKAVHRMSGTKPKWAKEMQQYGDKMRKYGDQVRRKALKDAKNVRKDAKRMRKQFRKNGNVSGMMTVNGKPVRGCDSGCTIFINGRRKCC
ncbi:hypothetical protein Ddc_03712 [Ditylenchus destructor]|nr:hypothetical protein Ddc_03712 [Ditylenchus destructor]